MIDEKDYALRRLVREVSEMRRLQRQYFSSKDRETLIAAKQKEADVDKLIETHELIL